MPKLPTRPAPPRRESDVTAEARIVLAAEHVVHWRNNVGALRDERQRVIHYGLCEGSADLIACVETELQCPSCGTPLPPIGRFVGIELKGPTGRWTDEQRAWGAVVEQAHGVYGLASSGDEVRPILYRARTRW